MTNMNEWAKSNTWLAKMNASKGLDSFDNYGGSSDFEEAEWVSVLGRNRDSDIMQTSNFECALEQLGGESKNVHIVHFGHWASGWFELLMVNPKSKRLIKKAFEIYESLKRYPILDENDYSDRENEYHSDFAENAKKDLAKALVKHFDLKYSSSLLNLAYDLNMECQSYYGNDSCISIYPFREPDSSDIDRLKTCLKSMTHHYGRLSKNHAKLLDKLGVKNEKSL